MLKEVTTGLIIALILVGIILIAFNFLFYPQELQAAGGGCIYGTTVYILDEVHCMGEETNCVTCWFE
jgi:hypothetical protein